MRDAGGNHAPMQRIALLIMCTAVAACGSPAARIDATAESAGLTREIVQGTSFRHVIYARQAAPLDATWTVYLDSDGVPWIDGRIPASDPTTRNPLALQLLLQSSEPALYVSRPCYHELHDARCSWQTWTANRYSPEVVDSMVAAIAAQLRARDARRVKLIGYSGGGVLAVLIAERLENVVAVVTIGANLDTDAWTKHHGYLPLVGSLNPARSTLPHPWQELHLQGMRDTVVPSATTRTYFERYPAAQRRVIDEYDHVCCWVREWTEVRVTGEEWH
jgi:hypothetical protein